MSINPLNDISKVYLEQVATQEVNIEEGMTLKDYKKKRSALKQKEKRADAKTSPLRRAGIHADKASPERAARHRANVDPDFEGNDERNYPGGKLSAKKVRKAKAVGELTKEEIQIDERNAEIEAKFQKSRTPHLLSKFKKEHPGSRQPKKVPGAKETPEQRQSRLTNRQVARAVKHGLTSKEKGETQARAKYDSARD